MNHRKRGLVAESEKLYGLGQSLDVQRVKCPDWVINKMTTSFFLSGDEPRTSLSPVINFSYRNKYVLKGSIGAATLIGLTGLIDLSPVSRDR